MIQGESILFSQHVGGRIRFYRNRDTWGFMFGISYNPITPFALKFLLSSNPVDEKALLAENLTLSKSELKMIKNLNMMLLNTQEP